MLSKRISSFETNVKLTLTYTGSAVNAKDAGTYTISATYVLNAKGNNYNIVIYNGTLTINPKTITLVWSSNTTYAYDGTNKGPVVVSVNGEAVGEEQDIINSLTYSGYSSQTGTHTAYASLDNDNYIVQNDSCDYTITKTENNTK